MKVSQSMSMVLVAASLVGLMGSGCSGGAHSNNASSINPSTASPSESSPAVSPGVPNVTADLSDAQALVLVDQRSTSTQSNLSKITPTGITSVLRYDKSTSQSGLTTADGDAKPLPAVSRFFISPDGAVIALLNEAISIADVNCKFVRLVRESTELACIDPDLHSLSDISSPERNAGIPGGLEPVQFDGLGNIYYWGSFGGFAVLKKWNVEDGSTYELIHDNISLTQFLVSEDGSVWLSGGVQTGQDAFFRRLKPTGELEDIIGLQVVNLISKVDNGIFVTLLKNTEPFTALYKISLDDGGNVGAPQLILSDNQFDGLFLIMFDMIDFQKSGSGDYYYFGKNNSLEDDRRLILVYPGAPTLASLLPEVSYVRNFRIFDQDIFYIGQDNSNKHVFHKMRLDDLATDEDLLKGENIEVYHFTAVNNLIYFDGLRFSDNTYIIGQIDQNNDNALIVLSPLEAKLIGLEFF